MNAGANLLLLNQPPFRIKFTVFLAAFAEMSPINRPPGSFPSRVRTRRPVCAFGISRFSRKRHRDDVAEYIRRLRRLHRFGFEKSA